ncbi:MBL fold metallo-hydrolase [Actinospica sp.]|uniref:MBL fold metallo-hydrolase n=1 Tax=Actinospica sp. TaxID=1872142 RepID=UPI002CFF3B70|nr:MBL fold metallo-hydrolase [Actinospica sp.]HWG25320.1 MBL fold metallo-hydrolase [Actinospica sp.]
MTFTLTVLGAATPYPAPDAACSGYLLRAGAAKVWVDAGFGTFANLQRHVDPADLDAIWISHLHLDHSHDLQTAFYGLAYGGMGLKAPIPVYGPPGWVAKYFGEHAGHFTDVTEVFEMHEIAEDWYGRVGDLRLSVCRVRHSQPAYGLRAEYEGRVLVYSGDTAPCESLVELAAGADLFVCEADFDSPEQRTEYILHSTPEEAAQMATAAGVKRLMVTHVAYSLGIEAATARAAAAYGGPTISARDNETHEI